MGKGQWQNGVQNHKLEHVLDNVAYIIIRRIEFQLHKQRNYTHKCCYLLLADNSIHDQQHIERAKESVLSVGTW